MEHSSEQAGSSSLVLLLPGDIATLGIQQIHSLLVIVTVAWPGDAAK